MTRAVLSRYFNTYRLAAYVLALYAALHTLGAVVSTPRFGPPSDAVVAMMKGVTLVVQGTSVTWYGFYRAFGWFVTVFLLFSMIVSWYLGGQTTGERRRLALVAWSLFLSHVAGTVIAWVYVFPPPIVFSALVAVLLGIGCLRDRGAAQERRAGSGLPP